MNIAQAYRWLFCAAPIPGDAVVYHESGDSFYLSRSRRRLIFTWEGQRRLCRLICLSNKYPPKGTHAYIDGDEFGLHDRDTDERFPIAPEGVTQYKLALKALWRCRNDRLESPSDRSDP